MAKEQETLGQKLLAALDDVTNLIGVTTETSELDKLAELRSSILQQLGDLVEKMVAKESEEYAVAVKGLGEASDAIRAALDGMESVANAIELAAKAVDLVAKVAPA